MRSKNQKAQKMRNRRAVILLTILTLVVGIALAFFYIQGRNKPDAEETPTPSPTAPVPTETESPTPEPAPTETPDLEPTPTPTPEPTPDPDEDRRSTRRNDVKVRALYLNPRSVRQNLDHYIELANKTEINAFVIDIKRDEGIISYDSDIPDVNAAKGTLPTLIFGRSQRSFMKMISSSLPEWLHSRILPSQNINPNWL